MRKFKRRSRRALSFRLFFVLAGALLLLAAFAPKANAQNVLVYFNFEDAVLNGPYDHNADVVGAPDFNPGGGLVPSTMTDNFAAGHTGAIAGTLLNRTVGDIDTANPGLAIGMTTTAADNFHSLTFSFNASAFSNMSFSFAYNTSGNGFNHVDILASTNGVTFVPILAFNLLSGGGFHILSGAIPAAFNNQPILFLEMQFSGGTSNGNNLETVIDNIQVTGVPEPATVAGGLLGVLGLCWHQRRRLIHCAGLRRA